MRALVRFEAGRPLVSRRAFEWWAAGIALFLQSGAFLPLFLSDPSGDLGDAAKAKLRLLSLPAYLLTLALLALNLRPVILAFRRSLLFLSLVLLPFLSIADSISPSTTLRRAVALLFSLLLAYALATRFTPRQLLLLTMIVLGPCIVASLLLLGISPGLARMPLDGTLRGVFLHKNSLGWYASILALVSAIVAIDGSLGLRRTAIVLLAASLACLAGSTSMTSIIATATACCMFGIYSALPRLHGAARVTFALITVQLTIFLMVALHEFLVPFLEALGKDATLTGRVPLWQLVDRAIRAQPLLGYGYQAFWTEANPKAWAIWSTIGWMAPHAHNGFRDALLSFGIGGMALFVAVLFRAIYQGAAIQCRAPEDGWLWLNVLLIMVIVMNLTESIFLDPNDLIFTLFSSAIIMFAYYGPAYAIRRGGVPERDPGRGTAIAPGAAGALYR